MKKLLPLAACLLFALPPASLAFDPSELSGPGAQRKTSLAAKGFLVYTEGSLRRSLRGVSFTRLAPNLALVKDTGSTSLAALRRAPGVLAAERNSGARLFAMPSDPFSGRMWHLENTRRRVSNLGPYSDPIDLMGPRAQRSVPDSDIDAPEAWEVEKGSGDTVVAIIDTGVAYTHADLEDNIWQNTDEVAANGADDDGNGYTDDTLGWNVLDSSNDPFDDMGHGTHVAGIVGAKPGNGKASAGVSWDVSLMPVKVFNSEGGASDADIAAGVLYAAENGADIVNGSFGAWDKMPVLEEIMAAHPEVLFVFAAGNDGSSNDRYPTYPCNSSLANVLCVASTGAADTLSPWSNFGRRSVEIAAPGDSLVSAIPFFWGCPRAPDPTSCYSTPADFSRPTAAWQSGGAGNDWGAALSPYWTESAKDKVASDSVSGRYAPNSDSWMMSDNKTIADSRKGCMYWMVAAGKLEEWHDYVVIEVSTDGGAQWQELTRYTGNLTQVAGPVVLPRQLAMRAPALDEASQVMIRYSLHSNGSVEREGSEIITSSFSCQGRIANVESMAGTSMAAPVVAGIAALVKSYRPAASAAQIRAAITSSGDRKKALAGLRGVSSARRANAAKALAAIAAP